MGASDGCNHGLEVDGAATHGEPSSSPALPSPSQRRKPAPPSPFGGRAAVRSGPPVRRQFAVKGTALAAHDGQDYPQPDGNQRP
jgi:hypothetical protein